MKPFQYNKKVWDDGNVDRLWQFGIVKNTSLLWVRYQNPTYQFFASGGIHVLLSFLASSLFCIELNNNKQSIAFEFFTEYSEDL
jgi:hypothetical protein